jgi:Glycosyl transferases group 1/Glycosyltransferase Family 4
VNVLVCTNMYPSQRRPSFGIFVREQVEDLRALGVGVEVLAFDASTGRSAYLQAARRLHRLIATADVDLVHAHYGLTGAIAVTQRQLPVITTFHGSDSNGFVPWQTAVSWITARLSNPVCVAPHLAQRLGLRDAVVIPAAVDTTVFRPVDRATARSNLGWRGDAAFALFPGSRTNPRKRPDLFDAALTEARRLVPGIQGVSLEGRSRSEVAEMMNAVDVTVLTSDYEGSPVAVRESLACQTPVVSVDVGDVASVLSGLPGCAVVRRDPAAIGHAVAAALDADRSHELRARAELDSRPRVAERLLALYELAVGR